MFIQLYFNAISLVIGKYLGGKYYYYYYDGNINLILVRYPIKYFLTSAMASPAPKSSSLRGTQIWFQDIFPREKSPLHEMDLRTIRQTSQFRKEQSNLFQSQRRINLSTFKRVRNLSRSRTSLNGVTDWHDTRGKHELLVVAPCSLGPLFQGVWCSCIY